MAKNGRLFLLGAALAFGLAAGPAPLSASSDYTPPRLWERVEISVFGGLGLPATEATSRHRADSGLAPMADNAIRTSSSPAVFAGAAAAFFIGEDIGFQAGFGYLKAGLESAGRLSWNSAVVESEGRGEVTAVPLYVCFFKSFEFPVARKRLRVHLAAGPALFFNSVLTESRAGVGVARDGLTDAVLVPVRVEDTTWISLGGTAGAGFDIPLSPRLAVVVEGRYHFTPRREFAWAWSPGVYDGVAGQVAAFAFDADAAAREARATTPLAVAPSFFQVAAGLKLVF